MTKKESKKLTEIQVHKKIKEISKIEQPLKIEKEIKKLSKQCNFSVQSLKKQLNYLLKQNKKDSSKIDVTNDTNDTLDTNVTNVTNNEIKASVTFVTLYQRYFSVLFSDTVLEKIIKEILLAKRPLLFGELALKTGKSEAHIRNTISKNKQYFGILKPNGKTSVTHVTNNCLEELRSKVEELKKIEEEKEAREKELKVQELKQKESINCIKEFIQNHKLKREKSFLVLDFTEVVKYSPKTADLLLDNPERFIEQIKDYYPEGLDIRVKNIPESSRYNIENLRKDNLNKLMEIEGRVTSLGEVRPVITSITFQCPSCGTLIKMKQNYRKPVLEEPKRCSCGRAGGFKVNSREESNACFIQIEDLQDKTDNPHSRRLKCVLLDKLADPDIIRNFTPGNEVQIRGILKEVPKYKGNRLSLFLNWVFEVKDVELIEKDIDISSFDDNTIKEINELAAKVDEEGITHLEESFCPEVHGYNKIKDSIMLQLSNRRNDFKNSNVRNKSNILLIGDPGIAKTIMCKFATKVSTGAKQATGGGSSAVGITASVVKEEDSMGGYRVEPGAMILAKDILFLDELNNLHEEDKPRLQEGMSEQKVSINKANLHVQMKVTCGMLAVANPIHGHFKEDSDKTIHEQFNIPSPILNRFDTIFMMRDVVHEDNDKLVADRMIMRHAGELKPNYSIGFLKKYFAYVRNSEEPEIPQEIKELLKEVYSVSRKNQANGVRVNARFFESLTRMSSAAAKMRLSKKIEKKDVKTALSVLSESQYNIPFSVVEKKLRTKNETTKSKKM